MADASKTETKVAKHIDEAIAKIEALNGTATTPPETKDRLKDILTNLALRSALAGLPDTCKECEEKLDARLSVRCPKHIGMMVASDFAKSKMKEHGPLLMAKAAMGAQAWFEKLTEKKDDEGEKVEPGEK